MARGDLVYAVGDIHGRLDLLTQLIDTIEEDASRSAGIERKTIIFLGDYIDRGPDSRGVVDLLLERRPEGFTAHCLKGNHEAMLLDFLADAAALHQWLANGGAITMQSYGVDVSGLARSVADPRTWQRALLSKLPDEHRVFFENLELAVSYGDYFFVHAGIRPGLPLDAQSPRDLIWIRGEFLRSRADFGKVVVHGHTPQDEPEVCSNRIAIDTGAVFTNRLTALRLEGGTQRFIQTELR